MSALAHYLEEDPVGHIDLMRAELGKKTQSSLAKGLRWFSDELGKLADSFTAVEKEPEDMAAGEETEE